MISKRQKTRKHKIPEKPGHRAPTPTGNLDIRKDPKWVADMLFVLADSDGTDNQTIKGRIESLKKAATELVDTAEAQREDSLKLAHYHRDFVDWYEVETTGGLGPDWADSMIDATIEGLPDHARDFLICPPVTSERMEEVKTPPDARNAVERKVKELYDSADGDEAYQRFLKFEKDGPSERYANRLAVLFGEGSRTGVLEAKKKSAGRSYFLPLLTDPFLAHRKHPVKAAWDLLRFVLPQDEREIEGDRVTVHRGEGWSATGQGCRRWLASADWVKRMGGDMSAKDIRKESDLRAALASETEERERLHFGELLDHATGAPGIDLPYRRSFPVPTMLT